MVGCVAMMCTIVIPIPAGATARVGMLALPARRVCALLPLAPRALYDVRTNTRAVPSTPRTRKAQRWTRRRRR